jgi:hypothetical protein
VRWQFREVAMTISTIEGYIENGQIRVPPGVQLPPSGQVFIVIPDPKASPSVAHIRSPRLADPKQAEYLRKTMVKEPS